MAKRAPSPRRSESSNLNHCISITIAHSFKKAHAPMRWPGAFNAGCHPVVHTRKLPESLVRSWSGHVPKRHAIMHMQKLNNGSVGEKPGCSYAQVLKQAGAPSHSLKLYPSSPSRPLLTSPSIFRYNPIHTRAQLKSRNAHRHGLPGVTCRSNRCSSSKYLINMLDVAETFQPAPAAVSEPEPVACMAGEGAMDYVKNVKRVCEDPGF